MEGATPFPWFLHFTLDTYLILLSVKQGSIKYNFEVFGMTRPGIEPRSPGSLANTLTTGPMSRFIIGSNEVVHALIKDINPKLNVTERGEFELTYIEAAVKHVSHYATSTQRVFGKSSLASWNSLQLKQFTLTEKIFCLLSTLRSRLCRLDYFRI